MVFGAPTIASPFFDCCERPGADDPPTRWSVVIREPVPVPGQRITQLKEFASVMREGKHQAGLPWKKP